MYFQCLACKTYCQTRAFVWSIQIPTSQKSTFSISTCEGSQVQNPLASYSQLLSEKDQKKANDLCLLIQPGEEQRTDVYPLSSSQWMQEQKDSVSWLIEHNLLEQELECVFCKNFSLRDQSSLQWMKLPFTTPFCSCCQISAYWKTPGCPAQELNAKAKLSNLCCIQQHSHCLYPFCSNCRISTTRSR